MAHSFTVNFTGDLPALFQRVKDKIIGEGGTFNGDTRNGKFSGETALGKVFLDYEVISANTIRFTITDKPFLVPNSKIETTVSSYLS